MDLSEELKLKDEAFEKKYAEVARNLAIKYGKTTDVGLNMLKGIARGVIYNVEPLYVPDIEYNKEEMLEDYRELEKLSKEITFGK